MPAVRGDGYFRLASALQELFVKGHGIVQHNLVTAYKKQGRGHSLQIAKERRNHGILAVCGVTGGIEVQQFRSHGGVDLQIFGVGFTGCGKVRPGGDGDDTAGQRLLQLLQLQTQGIAKATAGAFTAEGDLIGGVAHV